MINSNFFFFRLSTDAILSFMCRILKILDRLSEREHQFDIWALSFGFSGMRMLQ